MRKIISFVLLIALCIPVCTPIVSYAAMQNTVTLYDSTYSYYADGTAPEYNKHAIFKSNTGNPVFCGNHGLPSPVGDTLGDSKKLEMYAYDNETVRKVLYYGYLGPKEWKGFSEAKYNGVYKAGSAANKRVWCGIAVTGMALTKTQNYGYLYEVSGFKEFWEYIKSAPKPPEGFKTYVMYGNSSQQDLFTWDYNPQGNLTLIKGIEKNANLVKLCPEQYSLKGAKYVVSTDKNGKNVVGEFTTKADGTANTLVLAPGYYYVKETIAPKGFEVDAQTYKIEVEEDKDKCLNVEDKPIIGYIDMLLKKVDSTDEIGLEGAIFKVNYYKQLTSDTSSLTPDRTWEFKTGSKGEIALSEEYKVAGDELYKDDNGQVVGLIGTYEFIEKQAPNGYAKTDNVMISHIMRDEVSGKIKEYNAPTITNEPQTVSIIIQKIDENALTEDNKNVDLSGAIYEIRNANDEVVGSIITDVYGIGRIDELKPGEYRITEVKAPNGYLINSEEIVVNAITTDDIMINYEFYTESIEKPTSVEVIKYETKEGIKTNIKDATLQVIDSKGEVVHEFISTDEPHIIRYLPAGEYTLREIKAPEGYLLAEDVSFSVDEYTETICVEMENKRKSIIPEKPEIPAMPDKPKEPVVPDIPKEEIEQPDVQEKPVVEVVEKEEIEKVPDTGDENYPYVYVSIAIISLIFFTYLFKKKYVKKY